MNVLIVGASAKPHRYAYKALEALTAKLHQAYLFSPKGGEVNGLPVQASFEALKATLQVSDQSIDTITLYVNPTRLEPLKQDLLSLSPRRIIFNPGTYSPALAQYFEANGVECVEDCTLIMLREAYF